MASFFDGKVSRGKFLITAGICLTLISPAFAHIDRDPPIIQPGAPGQPSRELSVEESLELGQSYFTEADVAFMQDMIIHHGQAVDMGDLIEARTSHAGIILAGERISLSQTTEIEMMEVWLSRRGQALAREGGHHHGMDHGDMSDMPVMTGMLSPAQMAELAAAEGAGFDALYLSGMILHHQGALDMVAALLSQPGAGEDPELSEFLASIIADQSAEITRMQSMLAGL